MNFLCKFSNLYVISINLHNNGACLKNSLRLIISTLGYEVTPHYQLVYLIHNI